MREAQMGRERGVASWGRGSMGAGPESVAAAALAVPAAGR